MWMREKLWKNVGIDIKSWYRGEYKVLKEVIIGEDMN